MAQDYLRLFDKVDDGLRAASKSFLGVNAAHLAIIMNFLVALDETSVIECLGNANA